MFLYIPSTFVALYNTRERNEHTFAYIYICMYVCMYVCMYICICRERIYMCLYKPSTFKLTILQERGKSTHLHTYIYMHVCMYVYMYIYIYICISYIIYMRIYGAR